MSDRSAFFSDWTITGNGRLTCAQTEMKTWITKELIVFVEHDAKLCGSSCHFYLCQFFIFVFTEHIFPLPQSSVACLASLTIIFSIAISYFWTGQRSRQPMQAAACAWLLIGAARAPLEFSPRLVQSVAWLPASMTVLFLNARSFALEMTSMKTTTTTTT